MKTIESIPNAERTFEALRNLGYDLNASVADIIDNSITDKVKATKLSVIFEKRDSDGKFICRIIDNGLGMASSVLEEAMRIGTRTSYTKNNLGKFGMGMKTASLSHCNILTVISKKKDSDILGYRWDLGHVHKTKNWSLLKFKKKEIEEILKKEKLKINQSGTIILWDDIFKIREEYDNHKTTDLANKYFYTLVGKLKLHLRIVFHRFLDINYKEIRNIKIQVNGENLNPWDPYCKKEKSSFEVKFEKGISKFKFDRNQPPVFIKGYVLPNMDQFSSEEARKEAKGLLSWNASQGYYVYRADRMIRFGGWHGTKTKDEHDKLARISIDIDPQLDEHFIINVNKNNIRFPERVKNHLKDSINPLVVKRAKEQYNKTNQKKLFQHHFTESGLAGLGTSLQPEKERSSKTALPEKSNQFTERDVNEENAKTQITDKLDRLLHYKNNKRFEVAFDSLNNNHLWRLADEPENKFKIIINTEHSLYSRMYAADRHKFLITVIDAIFYSLAFTELYFKDQQSSLLFDDFKTVFSEILEKTIKKKLI